MLYGLCVHVADTAHLFPRWWYFSTVTQRWDIYGVMVVLLLVLNLLLGVLKR